jgi:hypothetical protein
VSVAACFVTIAPSHDGLRTGPCGEGGKPPQVAEDRYHLGATALKHAIIAGAVDEFGHLRCQEPPELSDALLALLRDFQLRSHGVEAVGKPLKFIAGPDLDPVVELPRANALGTLFKQADRLGHPLGQNKGEQTREGATGEKKTSCPPQGGINRPERLGEGLLDHHRPVRASNGRRSGRNGGAPSSYQRRT